MSDDLDTGRMLAKINGDAATLWRELYGALGAVRKIRERSAAALGRGLRDDDIAVMQEAVSQVAVTVFDSRPVRTQLADTVRRLANRELIAGLENQADLDAGLRELKGEAEQ